MKNLKFINFNSKKKTNEFVYLFGDRVTGTIGRTFISCILLLAFFYTVPIVINFVEEDILTTEYKNDSRKIMVYKLEGKSIDEKEIETDNVEIFNEKDLLSDILTLNDLENDSVRLSASTIKQLFEDTIYSLSDVRKNKLVKPVALTWLPHEITKIENTKKRKELFLQIVLPLVLEENNKIKLDRIKLFSIINKSSNSEVEKKWLNKKYWKYKKKKRTISSDCITPGLGGK